MVPACASFCCHLLKLPVVLEAGPSSVHPCFINFIFESCHLLFYAKLVCFHFNHNHIECWNLIWMLECCLLRSVLQFFFFCFFCETDVEIRFRKMWNGCRHPFHFFLFFFVLQMLISVSEKCETNVDIHFTFFWNGSQHPFSVFFFLFVTDVTQHRRGKRGKEALRQNQDIKVVDM